MAATLPLRSAFGIDAVAAGGSLESGDGDHAFLMRAFPTLEARTTLEHGFYGSEAWLTEHREAVLGPLLGYHTVVLDVPEATVGHLRTNCAKVADNAPDCD